MEYKCNVCGNVFDDTLGTCPACGSVVLNSPVQNESADQYEAPQIQSEPAFQYDAPTVEVDPQPQSEQPSYNYGTQPEQPGYNYGTQQQNAQGQPNYQYGGQPNYQQPNYQQPYQNYPQGGYGYKDPNAKSKIAAGILGILIGALGVHNFYLGYTGKGIAQVLITFLSCGTLSWASAIWGLIEGILILAGSIATDANGRPLSD